MTKSINKKVNVTAVYFRSRQDFTTFPKRIECDGDIYTFEESALQYLIKKGQQIVRLLDMTDGKAKYRLKSEDESNWTLVSITQ